jgi:hypothetical protein
VKSSHLFILTFPKLPLHHLNPFAFVYHHCVPADCTISIPYHPKKDVTTHIIIQFSNEILFKTPPEMIITQGNGIIQVPELIREKLTFFQPFHVLRRVLCFILEYSDIFIPLSYSCLTESFQSKDAITSIFLQEIFQIIQSWKFPNEISDSFFDSILESLFCSKNKKYANETANFVLNRVKVAESLSKVETPLDLSSEIHASSIDGYRYFMLKTCFVKLPYFAPFNIAMALPYLKAPIKKAEEITSND